MALALAGTLVGFIWDYLTKDQVSASLFYVLPVLFGAWFLSRRAGLLLALLSSTSWTTSYLLVGKPYSGVHIFFWNLASETAIYLAAAGAASKGRELLQRQRLLTEELGRLNGALDREMLNVGDLQRKLLPRRPPELRGYEWEPYYATSARAGGDYYDFMTVADRRVGILVADASGHGAPAAVVMAMTRMLLSIASNGSSSPDELLSEFNRRLAATLPEGLFVTVCLVLLEPETGRLDYALAGHDPPLVIRADNGGTEELPVRGGPPLGPFPESRFESGSALLRPGDALLIYTDGLTEAASPAGELFGVERVLESISAARSMQLADLRKQILRRVDAHTGGAPLRDDLTLLMLRRQQDPAQQTA
ncbi:MAG TPA: PP2C family protein-serine/threonine phosphatase [Candidatus Saccharimonadales bacterium]|nr:PP2C family protein-serine/threonine phosphatase [Candidatus Saccharimonadales bacterium]